MKTRGFAFTGILAMALMFGGALYAVAEVLPEDESKETDEELSDDIIDEGAEVSEEEDLPEMGPRRMKHPGLMSIMNLDEDLSENVNITQLKEDIRELMDELRTNGYFNRSVKDRNDNRTWEPRDNRTPTDDREVDEDGPLYRYPFRMRHHHRHMMDQEEDCEVPVEENILVTA